MTGPDEECGTTTDTSGGGRRPPWLTSDSPADVVVINGRESTVEAVVSVGDRERTLTVPGGDQWISGDIIENDETTSVSVTIADGGGNTIEWERERENGRVAVFVIASEVSRESGSERIRADVRTQSSCPVG